MPTKAFGLGSLGFGRGGSIQGGNIKPIAALTESVQFPVGNNTLANPTAMPDTTAITMSYWFMIPSSPDISGYGTGSYVNLNNSIRPLISSATLFAEWGDSTTTVDGFHAVSGILGYKAGIYSSFYTQIGTDGGGNLGLSNIAEDGPDVGALASSLTLEDWHHVLLGIQVNQTLEASGGFTNYFNPSKGFMVVDGVFAGWNKLTLIGKNNYIPATLSNGFPSSLGLPIIKGGFFSLPRSASSIYTMAEPNILPHRYSNVQVWFNQYIDPLATLGTGTLFDPTQTSAPQGGSVLNANTVLLLGQAVVAAGTAGVDPTFMLSVMNIETIYGQLAGIYGAAFANPGGIFQLDGSEVTAAFPNGTLPPNTTFTDNNNQMIGFVYQNFNTWSDTALQQWGSDPTGIYRYTVFNQGQNGAPWIWNNTSSLIVDSPYATNMMRQTWAKNGRWGNLALNPNTNTVQDWLNNLQTVWNLATNDANGRLMSVTNQNINAFRTQTGLQVPPETAAQLFGQPDLQFNGDKTPSTGFQHNNGTDGTFAYAGAALTDFFPGPP